VHLPPQRLYLASQRLVFGRLAIEEARGRERLLGQPLPREEVHIGLLIIAVLEVIGLDQTPFHQGLQAVIHPAQAYAELARQLALADLGLLVQQAQYLGPVLVGEQKRALFSI
jgi:hypothetical protein